MKQLFDFDVSSVTAEIKLAFRYTPRVLENRIVHRPYTGLLYVAEGEYEYTFPEGSFCAGAGSLIYLPPGGVPYNYRITCDTQTLQIEVALTDTLSQTPIVYGTHPMLLFSDAKMLKGKMDAVISGFAKKDTASVLWTQAELYALLSACVQYTDVGEAQLRQRLAPALLHLQQNYTKAVEVRALAALCHMSPSQLRRLFKKLTGKTPIEYKNALLLESAKNHLGTGERSVGEIAELLGFYDIYAFSHFFSAAEGMSPSAYKKGRRAQ